ncbi:hypothetical protein T492DRAFT_889274 [Pavlovales sp. CCMP2436]|nr:hypothetical protein T492DRAFT_889274 [Pavlovales sp. CCMP2436]
MDGGTYVSHLGVKAPGNSLDCTRHDADEASKVGRAGMAAIALAPGTAALELLARLYKTCEQELPPYARPLFVRVLSAERAPQLTATFKYQKAGLQADGWLGNTLGDEVYFWDDRARSFVPLTQQLERQIESGSLRLQHCCASVQLQLRPPRGALPGSPP